MNENIHTEIKKEMEGISPFLAKKLDRIQGSIPDYYFLKMQGNVLEKLEVESDKNVAKVISIQKKSTISIMLAAASLVGILVLASVFYVSNKNTNTLDLAVLDKEEINAYLLDHAFELEDTQLEHLPSKVLDADMLQLSDDDIKSVLDEYLYQVQTEQIN